MVNKLIAIVPVYNEEKTIESVLLGLSDSCRKIIVINDKSTDSSYEKIVAIQKKIGSNIILLNNRKNSGKGYSLKRGYKCALSIDFDYAINFDADGERDVNNVLKAYNRIKSKNGSMLLGYRKESGMRSKMRLFLNKFSTFFINMFTGYKLKDSQSGFVIVSKSALKKFKLKSLDFAVETELMLEAFRNNLRIMQYPVKVPKISNSHYHFRNMLINNLFFDKWVIRWCIRNRPNMYQKVVLMFCFLGFLVSYPLVKLYNLDYKRKVL